MTLLNEANKVYVGSSLADAIYVGSTKVWPPAAAGITPPAFRSLSNTAYGAKAQTDIDKPAGTVEKDIMFASVFIGRNSVITNDVAPPDGTWTQIGTKTNVQQGTAFYGQFAVFWKRAGASEPAFYTFTHGDVTYSTQGVIQSIKDCATSGNPVDAVGQAQYNGLSDEGAYGKAFILYEITTTQDNDLILQINHNWDASGELYPPQSYDGSIVMTERLDHLTYLADNVQAAAGGSLNRYQSQASYLPAAGFLIALKGK